MSTLPLYKDGGSFPSINNFQLKTVVGIRIFIILPLHSQPIVCPPKFSFLRPNHQHSLSNLFKTDLQYSFICYVPYIRGTFGHHFPLQMISVRTNYHSLQVDSVLAFLPKSCTLLTRTTYAFARLNESHRVLSANLHWPLTSRPIVAFAAPVSYAGANLWNILAIPFMCTAVFFSLILLIHI